MEKIESLHELISALNFSDPSVRRKAIEFATDAANLMPVSKFYDITEDDDRFGDKRRRLQNSYQSYLAATSGANNWYGALFIECENPCTPPNLCLIFFLRFARSAHLQYEHYMSVVHDLNPIKWDYSKIGAMHKDLFLKYFA